MSATHTPGPWAYHKWGRSSGTQYGIETSDHKHGIAGICPNGNASTMVSMDQHEANARLIAAAPELLAALTAARNWLREYHHQMGDPMDEGVLGLDDQISAAIAKATGTT